MAQALREASRAMAPAPGVRVRALTRVIVLPFRTVRPDPVVDFLSVGLAEAISATLSGFDSLLVRSSAAAAKTGTGQPDPKALAREAGVDVAVFGTLMRAGNQVRVTMQLVETPSGSVRCSRTAQGTVDDLFVLQDTLAGDLVRALAPSLTAGVPEASRTSVPATPAAYEYYLRATQVAAHRRMLAQARDLYRRCLAEDPRYAPAWARLGRVHRVMAKYSQDGDPDENFRVAQEAFGRALELDPDLPITHYLYTYLEIEELGRSTHAMVRLLERVRRHPAAPELFAALVVACRYCGLFEASVAADRRARQLDPGIRTSVAYTYWVQGDYEKAIFYDDEDVNYVYHCSLMSLGRQDEAIAAFRALERSHPPGLEYYLAVACRSALEGRGDECRDASRRIVESRFHDPEGLYFVAQALGRIGEVDGTLDLLARVVGGGFSCPSLIERDPCFERLREHPRYQEALALARASVGEATAAYVAAGGPLALGWTPEPAAAAT